MGYPGKSLAYIVVLVQISMFAMNSAFTFATYASVHLLLFGKKKIRESLFFRPMVAVASTASFLVSVAAVVWQLLSASPGGPASCKVSFPDPLPLEHVCVCAQEVHCQYPSPGPWTGRAVGDEGGGSLAFVVAGSFVGFSLGLVAGLCICCRLTARRQELEAPVSLLRNGGDRPRRSAALAVPY